MLDLVEFKKSIKNKTLDNFYILEGEEIGVLNMYINQMGSTIVRADEVQEIWRRLTVPSLSNNSDVVFVVRGDKKFLGMEKVWTGIHNKIKNGILVLCYDSLDKRSKFFKEFEDNIVMFEKMTEAQLLHYCKKHLRSTSDENLKYLIYLCNNDYSRVENEIDKIKRLNKPVTRELLEDIIIPPKSSTPFTFVDSILKGLYWDSIYDLNNLLSNGESGIMLLGLLYSNFRNAILVIGNDKGASGVNGYVAKSILDKLCYKPDELLTIIRIIQKYEIGVKTGRYDEKFAITGATLEILCV